MTPEQKRRIEKAGMREEEFEPQGESGTRIRELEAENTRLNEMLDALLEGRQE